MKVSFAVLLCVLSSVPLTIAQVPLRTTQKPLASIPATSHFLPVKLDSLNNVYIRLTDTAQPPSDGPLVKLPLDGSNAIHFDLHTVPGYGRVVDFTPTEAGDVYVLMMRGDHKPGGMILARFGPDGTFTDRFELEPGIIADNIAAFSNGELLMIFSDLRKRANSSRLNVGIFSSTGQFLRDVRLGDAENRTTTPISQRDEGSDPLRPGPPASGPIVVLPGPDGNVYLRRTAPSPAVFQITANGEVSRFDLMNPAGQVVVRNAVVGSGKMFVQYDTLRPDKTDPKRTWTTGNACEIIDLSTGRSLKFFRDRAFGTVIGLHNDSLIKMSWWMGKLLIEEVPVP